MAASFAGWYFATCFALMSPEIGWSRAAGAPGAAAAGEVVVGRTESTQRRINTNNELACKAH